MASVEELKQLSILGVADSLGMELERTGSHTYSWKEHDSFTINISGNYFNWFARSNGGDVIKMVQVVQEELTGQPISFKQAKHFLEEGDFEAVDRTEEVEREPFKYYLQDFETKFIEAREYLKEERGLSDETIDFFGNQGVLAQATKKTGNYYEPVIVFKSLDAQNEVIGASLQGIRENHDLYERGRLKQIMRGSDGLTGMHIDIGQPKRLVFAEAPIDLMSYYELHKESLSDVRLVAMDGLKESTISRHVADLLLYEMGELKQEVDPKNYSSFLAHTAEVSTFFQGDRYQDLITLAVDNDGAGQAFISRLADKQIPFLQDLPPLPEGAEKMDWNDYLKESKEKALDRSQGLSINIGGELINRNSSYLEVKTLSVNPNYITDNGKEMLDTLKQSQLVNQLADSQTKGGQVMADNQGQSFLDRVESILRGERTNRQNAEKEELERDSDGDGIPDVVEKNMGTNPLSPDTDGDGKSDHEEVSFGSNPIEADQTKEQLSSSSKLTKTVSELIQAKDSKGLSKVLKEGVRDYFKSDTYKDYLTVMSKFHNYSPRNIQMIVAQNPKATHVASFKKWKDDFERNVNKGEKALRIFAPITLKRKDPKTNEPLLDENGNEQTYTSFKLVPVFDVSQTNGKELAKPIYELEGTYEDYGNLYKSAKEVSEANGVPIIFKDDLGGAKGIYSRQTEDISILKGMSEQQTLKTLFHEMAHSELHTLDNLIQNPLSQSTKELQAESVAFVVASHYGLDTSDYTFAYLASWTEDREGLTDLEDQIKVVQKEANSLITKIDQALEKYQSKELTKDAFQEKLSRLKSEKREVPSQSKEKAEVKDSPKKERKSDNEMSL